MKGNTMPEVTTLNLNEPITREQYEHAVTHLAEYLEDDLRRRMGWCTERFRYFQAIIPEFDTESSTFVYFHNVPTGSDYAELLRNMRARLLWYTNAGVITLDTAQEIFRSCGMPEYVRSNPNKSGTRLRVYLRTMEMNVAGDEQVAWQWVTENFADFLTRVIDGKSPQDDDKIIPGSFRIGGRVQAEVMSSNPNLIDESDTLRPSYT